MNRFKLTAGIPTLAMGLLLVAGPASAQVYAPGPTTTSTSTSTTSTTAVGNTTTTLPGATTTAAPTTTPPTTAPASGNQSGGTHVKGETFTNNLCGYQPGATVSLNVDGQAGPSATADGNGCVAVQVTVLDNSHVRVNGVTFNASCGSNSVVTTGPGSNGASLSETDSFTINCAATPSTTSSGGLAFTGANIMKLGGAALLLIAFGAGLVAVERRRSRLQG